MYISGAGFVAGGCFWYSPLLYENQPAFKQLSEPLGALGFSLIQFQ